MKKLVILGLGNTILTDDGAGIYVVQKIREMVEIPDNNLGDDITPITHNSSLITIKEASIGGFNFIDLLTGFDRAVIIDAIHTNSGHPGEFYELDPAALKPSARLSSLHGIDFATACEMAKQMSVPFPSEIKIFVIEAKDEFTFAEKCTEEIEKALPKFTEFILDELKRSQWL